ncbi:phage antirepressor N-terminal domain-containing protein [Desulfofundulus thermocisternus]|uniref:phage antirepressor N-terminal domain-containing protein n=1 Tax=Desulfofundulus thermocisternus TaxID=42471 RepID=UPI000481B953|nr:phage antirepressor N-terminal domain-containing protein [Desulfofundulus thermocisternus]
MSETRDVKVLTVQKVRFYDDELVAAVVEENKRQEIYVAVTPICEKLGVKSQNQRIKIQTNPVYKNKYLSTLISTENNGNYRREVFMLHIDMLPFWLAGISPSKVKPEAVEPLIRYQTEAARVLRDYFLGPGYAINPARVDLARLEAETERLKIERIKAQIELEQVQAEREKNMRLLAFVEKYPLPADFQKAVISRLAGLEVQPTVKYYATEELAGKFTFEFGTRITGMRLAMLAKAHGVRPNREAGEMENEFAVVSITPAVNKKTGRVIEGKVVEQILYKEAAVPVLRSLVRQWLEAQPVKPRKKPRKAEA